MTARGGAAVTILRHGDTFAPGETLRRIGARTDLPLVSSGEAQARAAGAVFRARGLRFDRVLVGPLERTRRTAALALAGLNAPNPEEVAALAEIDHGPDEGRPEVEVVARIGAEALARWDAALEPAPGWLVDAPARLAWWRGLLAEARGEVLAVTSNGAARFALAANTALASALSRGRLRTGAWGRIVRGGEGWTIEEWDKRG